MCFLKMTCLSLKIGSLSFKRLSLRYWILKRFSLSLKIRSLKSQIIKVIVFNILDFKDILFKLKYQTFKLKDDFCKHVYF